MRSSEKKYVSFYVDEEILLSLKKKRLEMEIEGGWRKINTYDVLRELLALNKEKTNEDEHKNI